MLHNGFVSFGPVHLFWRQSKKNIHIKKFNSLIFEKNKRKFQESKFQRILKLI